MSKFWALVLISIFIHSNVALSLSTSILSSIDPQEDMDLLIAAKEEIEQSFNQDDVSDTVKLIDVNVQEETPRRKQANPILEKPSEQPCLPQLDLVFLLDSAGSIKRIYQEHVRWAVALVDSLPIEPDSVRVAAVQYAGFPLTEFALGTYPSAEDVRKHLENINFRGGNSRTGYALRKAEGELFRPDRGARENVLKVIVVFTDGASIDDPLKPAQQLRQFKGVKIFVVSLKPTAEQMNKIAGSNANVFGPNDLKSLRDVLINEAEKIRACIRIGDNYQPFKNRAFVGGATVSPLALNWLSIGRNFTKKQSVFRNDIKDIIELSRASAAISAARPGMIDRENTLHLKPTLFSTTKNPSTTSRPFLGVKVVDDMGEDVFESPVNSRPSTTTNQPLTKKTFKLREFTFAPTTIRLPIPIVQNGVPSWRLTTSTIKPSLTPTFANNRQTIRQIVEHIPKLNPLFPTLRTIEPVQTTTISPRIQLSRVNAFPGVTCPHDILFIVDSSGSVQKSYNQQKIVLSDILSNIDIGNETHRVALLQFAGFKIQKTEWTYNSFADGPTLIKAVENIRHFTGTTFLGAALNSARQVLEQRRRGIPSLVILLSDGYSQDNATRAAEQIRQINNSEFYALTVNNLSNMPYLTQLVGSPQNVFSRNETEALKHLILNRLHCRF